MHLINIVLTFVVFMFHVHIQMLILYNCLLKQNEFQIYFVVILIQKINILHITMVVHDLTSPIRAAQHGILSFTCSTTWYCWRFEPATCIGIQVLICFSWKIFSYYILSSGSRIRLINIVCIFDLWSLAFIYIHMLLYMLTAY